MRGKQAWYNRVVDEGVDVRESETIMVDFVEKQNVEDPFNVCSVGWCNQAMFARNKYGFNVVVRLEPGPEH